VFCQDDRVEEAKKNGEMFKMKQALFTVKVQKKKIMNLITIF